MTQLDLFQDEFKALQNDLNPNASSEVHETVYSELDFLLFNMLENCDEYFEFKQHKDVSDIDYDMWLRELAIEAFTNACQLIKLRTK